MEKITFIYESTFNDTDLKRIDSVISDKEDCGLRDYDVCQKFEDFMQSVGFSEQNVLGYFRE